MRRFRGFIRAALPLALVATGSLSATQAVAVPGDNLRTIIADRTGTDCASYNAAGNHSSVGVGIAFDGTNLLISCYSDNTVVAVDPADGSQVAIHNITNAGALGALAWDAGRGLLWACRNFSDVGTIDLATNQFTFLFNTLGCFDGLAYDGSDDSLWVSHDVSFTIEHYSTTGTQLSNNNASGLIGNCGNSGIAVGGAKLYLANNGCSEIYEVEKDFSASTLFAGFPARLEDLECDNLTFLPDSKAAIWSIDAYDNILNAWEIPNGACLFGGGAGQIRLDPPTATNEAGTDHGVTATLADSTGAPIPGSQVTFQVVSGPNAGQQSDPGECSTDPNCISDLNGQTTWTYTGTGGAGTDVIEACFVDARQTRQCARAEKTWEVSRLDLALDPPTAENEAGTEHTVTATVTRGGQPVAGVIVSFAVVSGENTGASGTCSADPGCATDANGQVSWTYASNGNVGADVIEGCITQPDGSPTCLRVHKRWVDTTAPEASCIETTNPHGQTTPPAGSTTLPGSRGGQNEDGYYKLDARDSVDPTPDIYVEDTGSGTIFGPFAPGTKIKYTQAPGATPSQKKIGSDNGQAGDVEWHITGKGDAAVYAVDDSGNRSAKVSCKVPPPPK